MLLLPLLLLLTGLMTGCAIPRVSAEARLFLDLSLEFLGEYRIPQITYEGTRVGGLSAITYDRQRDRFYALSDDRSTQAPARFYTLKADLTDFTRPQPRKSPPVFSLDVESVTLLKQENGEAFARGTIDPEGIALSPQATVFVSSEGVAAAGVPPAIQEFDLETGTWRQRLPIPNRYLPRQDKGETSGVQDNLGWEALTINPGSYGSRRLEPFRVFVATESALAQDGGGSDLTTPARWLHYLVGDGPPVLISEHLYPIEPPPPGGEINGLTEILALDQGGHFLSLERSYGAAVGASARIYQVATGGATDISGMTSLKGGGTGIQPIRKQLLLDLKDLERRLDNLEGFTIGPRLADGSDSLLVISDDNFSRAQVNQVLLFRLRKRQG
ncbi:esterase-like activity of phytase family protein [Leptolyngbya sp. 'hensonii']|uniref:esterase-like activity of phytase family protein n=1 Tax=Leptolyngbya sp. 'hensonii' TaxID=1922337 RepID=UPI00209BB566|nr:esterase-like activity of phytase family protein [Leptolyngbya sp. 'hensonii']